MMVKYIKIVYLKELMDAFRDRRTLLTTLMLPLILYPLMFTLMGKAVGNITETAESNITVAVVGSGKVNDILALDSGITAQTYEESQAMQDLKDGKLALVLVGTDQADGKLAVEIVYDDKKTSGSLFLTRVATLIGQYNQAAIAQYLEENNTSLEALSPVTQSQKTISEASGEQNNSGAGEMLSMMVPMLLVILLAVGGMATASDLFAGEKERKTMEPLLCTRAGRGAILTGKLLTVMTFAILSVVATVVGMAISYKTSPDLFGMTDSAAAAASNGTFSLQLPMVLLTVVLVLVMALVFSGIHVVIATWSRTAKESATYGSFIMLACYVPVFSSMMMKAGDVKSWMMFVPVMNVTSGLKMMLGGVTDYLFLGGSIGVSLVVLIVVMGLARWMFSKETIMLR